MSLEKILENWSDYDKRKIKSKPGSKDFACTEPWEVNYLVDRVKKVYTNIPGDNIHKAILWCCKELHTPQPREPFIKCVLNKLGIFI